jgi:hypothetical protein
VGQPGKTTRVDAERFGAVREAYLKVLPAEGPGLTPREIQAALRPLLEEMFPGGAKLGWWAKSVQLDLEAKGIAVRAATPPVRLRRA